MGKERRLSIKEDRAVPRQQIHWGMIHVHQVEVNGIVDPGPCSRRRASTSSLCGCIPCNFWLTARSGEHLPVGVSSSCQGRRRKSGQNSALRVLPPRPPSLSTSARLATPYRSVLYLASSLAGHRASIVTRSCFARFAGASTRSLDMWL